MQPLGAAQLYDLFDKHDIPARTRQMIVEGFRTPGRSLYTNQYIAVSEAPCPKTGFHVASAGALERMAVFSYIFDPAVLSYLEGPLELNLAYAGKGKRAVRQVHIPLGINGMDDDPLVLNSPMRYASQEDIGTDPRGAARRLGRRRSGDGDMPGFVNTEMAAGIADLAPEAMTQPDDIARLVANTIDMPNSASVAEILVNCRHENLF